MLLSLIVSGSEAFTLDQLLSFLESTSKSPLSYLTRSVYGQILCYIFVVNGTYNNPLLIMKSGNSIGKPTAVVLMVVIKAAEVPKQVNKWGA
ncbi:hypothetical protein NC651_031395 [Populus alba x Populus x berolinensis]|nr:hypothetical protein NC651_031395 [Populus alba x Populus x berolinensis]